MSVGTPGNEQIVINNISVDVARTAPDSNPYLSVHWLNSLINGLGRRVFDFYGDLRAAELRLMPDTADDTTAPRWGAIFGKTKNLCIRRAVKNFLRFILRFCSNFLNCTVQ